MPHMPLRYNCTLDPVQCAIERRTYNHVPVSRLGMASQPRASSKVPMDSSVVVVTGWIISILNGPQWSTVQLSASFSFQFASVMHCTAAIPCHFHSTSCRPSAQQTLTYCLKSDCNFQSPVSPDLLRLL